MKPLKRVNFFPGQILSAEDLRTEQEYIRESRRKHNRLFVGHGVAEGLEVTVANDSGGLLVSVSPGYAIDPAGNELELCRPTTLRVNLRRSPRLVVVRYRERPSDPVPAATGDGETSEQPSRIEEICEVALVTRPDSAAVTLALLAPSTTGLKLDRRFTARKLSSK